MLYLIKAIIRPHWLSEFRIAMNRAGVDGITETEVRGYGRQGGKLEYYRGVRLEHGFMSKVALEMVVSGERLDGVLGAIIDAVNTGYEGDGKIFVLSLNGHHSECF